MFRGDPGTHGDPGVQSMTPLDAPIETQVLRNLLLIPPWSHISSVWWWPWRNLVSLENLDVRGGARHPWGPGCRGGGTLGPPRGDPGLQEPPPGPTLEPHLEGLVVGRRNLVYLEEPGVQGGPRYSRGDPGTHGDPGVWVVAPVDHLMETHMSRNLLLIPPWSHI